MSKPRMQVCDLIRRRSSRWVSQFLTFDSLTVSGPFFWRGTTWLGGLANPWLFSAFRVAHASGGGEPGGVWKLSLMSLIG